MRATGGHSGTISRTAPAARLGPPGPQRCGIPHQYSAYLDSPVVLVLRSACAGDDPAQPHPVPPILEPKLLNRLRDVLHPHLHSVEVRHSTVHRPVQRRRAIRGLTGIVCSTLLKQKGTQRSNVRHDGYPTIRPGRIRPSLTTYLTGQPARARSPPCMICGLRVALDQADSFVAGVARVVVEELSLSQCLALERKRKRKQRVPDMASSTRVGRRDGLPRFITASSGVSVQRGALIALGG